MNPGAAPMRPSPAPQSAATRAATLRGPDSLSRAAYGALGLPLAFAALPLYVLLPAHYAEQHGVPLAALGLLLLAARLLDALTDPWIGRVVDRRLGRPDGHLTSLAVAGAVLLLGGFTALFNAPALALGGILTWCALSLALTYLGYSLLGVLHQAWGSRLGGDAATRASIVAWREGASLVGVLLASVLPGTIGLGPTTAAFGLLLATALALLLVRAPAPRPIDVPAPATRTEPVAAPVAATGELLRPWRQPAFRRLLAAFLVNGIASAIPATLVLFFVRDRLDAAAWAPGFLAAYFAAAALSMPLWLRAIRRRGLVTAWRWGMLLAVAAFIGAAGLAAGDAGLFAVVCLLTGIALGADLAVPGALLTGVIRRAGDAGRHEGTYVGWWNFATKLNLALAAGLALPALQFWGYEPGARSPAALTALTAAYCLVPCALKLAALALLPRLDEPAPDSGENA